MRTTPAPTGRGCAWLFGIPFIVAGLAAGWFLYFNNLNLWWSARSWVETPCRLESVDLVRSRSSKGGVTYRVTAAYTYQFNGMEFRSDAVAASSGADNIGDFQQRVYRALKAACDAGGAAVCYVNPGQPGQALLNREFRWGLYLLLSMFPALFPAIGFAVVAAGWPGGPARGSGAAEPWRRRADWAAGRIERESDGLAGVLIILGWLLAVYGPYWAAIVADGALLRQPLALLSLLPCAAVWVFWKMAAARLLTRRVFGRMFVLPAALPITPGSELAADLRFGTALRMTDVITARLACVRRTTRGSGRNFKTFSETLWQETLNLDASAGRAEFGGFALPLRVRIPAGLPGTEAGGGGGSVTVEWSLEVSARRAGKPARFLLPVFGQE